MSSSIYLAFILLTECVTKVSLSNMRFRFLFSYLRFLLALPSTVMEFTERTKYDGHDLRGHEKCK